MQFGTATGPLCKSFDYLTDLWLVLLGYGAVFCKMKRLSQTTCCCFTRPPSTLNMPAAVVTAAAAKPIGLAVVWWCGGGGDCGELCSSSGGRDSCGACGKSRSHSCRGGSDQQRVVCASLLNIGQICGLSYLDMVLSFVS